MRMEGHRCHSQELWPLCSSILIQQRNYTFIRIGCGRRNYIFIRTNYGNHNYILVRIYYRFLVSHLGPSIPIQ